MTKYIMDAYAWIEYFEGTKQGKVVQELLQDNEILTHSVTVAEVVSKMRRKGLNGELAFHALQGLTRIIPTEGDDCKMVGLLHAEMRAKIPGFGLADAFVLHLARDRQGRVVTGDHHFQHERGVLFLKK